MLGLPSYKEVLSGSSFPPRPFVVSRRPVRVNLGNKIEAVPFRNFKGKFGSYNSPVYSSISLPVARSFGFVKINCRSCFRCGEKGHIRAHCRNGMKCFFCGYVGHSEPTCSLVHKFQSYIRSIRNGGINSVNKVISTIGDNEDTVLASEIFLSDVVVEVRGDSVSVTKLNNLFHEFIPSDDHNWRIRLLPKGDFLVNFPSLDSKKEFLNRGNLVMGTISVVFHSWDFPEVCSFSPDLIRHKYKLSGLPPACWSFDVASFFLKSWGKLVEFVDKRRLGNGLLQCTVTLDVRKDLIIEDCWIALFEEKMFIVLVEDLENVTKSDRGKLLLKRKAIDDGLGGGDDDVGNNALGGMGGRIASSDSGGFRGNRGGGVFRGGLRKVSRTFSPPKPVVSQSLEEGEILADNVVFNRVGGVLDSNSSRWDDWIPSSDLGSSRRFKSSGSLNKGIDIAAPSYFSVLDVSSPLSMDQGKSNNEVEVLRFDHVLLKEVVFSDHSADASDCAMDVNVLKPSLFSPPLRLVSSSKTSQVSCNTCSSASYGILRRIHYEWSVCVSKWEEMLKVKSTFWNVSPSLSLYHWWNSYFLSEGTRRELDAEYNWICVANYDIPDIPVEDINVGIGVSSAFPSMDNVPCGSVNYSSLFDDSDYCEVVTRFHNIRASVRRCLEGDLDRISILEKMDQDLVADFIDENARFDKYAQDFRMDSSLSAQLSLMEDSIPCPVRVSDDHMVVSGNIPISSQSSSYSNINSNPTLYSIIDSFGFILKNPEIFETVSSCYSKGLWVNTSF